MAEEEKNIGEERLKIEKIENLQNSSHNSKADATFFGMLGSVAILFGIVGLKMPYQGALLLAPSFVLPILGLIGKKLYTDKKVNKLEKTNIEENKTVHK